MRECPLRMKGQPLLVLYRPLAVWQSVSPNTFGDTRRVARLAKGIIPAEGSEGGFLPHTPPFIDVFRRPDCHEVEIERARELP